jgi:peptidyl-prolyl cis-trans isomerase C
MTKTWIAVAISLSLVACGKGKTVPSTSGGKELSNAGTKGAPAFVEVNGKKLLESAALMEVDHRMTALRSQIPSNRVQQARQQALTLVVDQFVKKTLLLEEADRQGIRVSPEEEKNAFDRIQKNLPAGMTVEQVMRSSPIGEQRMRDEVITGIRIEKLMAAAIPGVATVAAEDVDAFIVRHREQLSTPETLRARHILLAFGTNDTAEVKAGRRKAADVIRDELVKGADFATLAQQRSDCPSRQRGGDLGYFPRGKMVKPFEDAAFSQEVGAIGDVVETPYGYHVIQVTERKPAGTVDREKIVSLLQRQQRDAALDRWLKELKAKASVKYSPTAPKMPERPAPAMQP